MLLPLSKIKSDAAIDLMECFSGLLKRGPFIQQQNVVLSRTKGDHYDCSREHGLGASGNQPLREISTTLSLPHYSQVQYQYLNRQKSF